MLYSGIYRADRLHPFSRVPVEITLSATAQVLYQQVACPLVPSFLCSLGHYLYVEASNAQPGQRGVIKLRDVYGATEKNWNCSMRFWYHMFGASPGALKVGGD